MKNIAAHPFRFFIFRAFFLTLSFLVLTLVVILSFGIDSNLPGLMILLPAAGAVIYLFIHYARMAMKA